MGYAKREFYNALFSSTEEILESYEEILPIKFNEDGIESVVLPKKELTIDAHASIIMPVSLKHEPLRFQDIEEKIITLEAPKPIVNPVERDYEIEMITKSVKVNKEIIASSLPNFVNDIIFTSRNHPNDIQLFLKDKKIIGYNYYTETAIFDDPLYYDIIDNYTTACIEHDIIKQTQNIHIKSSTLSRIENTKISVSKDMLFKSPYLNQGMTFIFNSETRNGKVKLSIFEKDDIIYISSYKDKMMASRLFFTKEELPQTLNDKSINALFKQRKDIKKRTTNEMRKSNYEDFFIDFENEMTGRELLVTQVVVANQCFLEFNGNKRYTDISHLVKDDFIMGLKLFCAYNSPELKRSIRRVSKETKKKIRGTWRSRRTRKWVWGTDKITYIYPNSQSNKSKSHHYVRPHFCKFYIKDLEKYAEYNPLYEDGKHSIVKWRSGTWKGGNDVVYHDGEDCHGYSRKAIRWLDKMAKEKNIDIIHAENGKELRVELSENSWYLVDGYCEKTNTVYEFHGNIWHGNPRLYEDDDTPHPFSKLTAKELYENTINKENTLKKMGFNLIVIWEDEWDKIINR